MSLIRGFSGGSASGLSIEATLDELGEEEHDLIPGIGWHAILLHLLLVARPDSLESPAQVTHFRAAHAHSSPEVVDRLTHWEKGEKEMLVYLDGFLDHAARFWFIKMVS